MKKIFIIVCSCFLIFSVAAVSSAARLVWDAPAPCGEPDTCPVEGYNIYYGEVGADQEYNVSVSAIGQELAPLRLSPGSTYWFSVSAYNAAGESARCEPVEYAVPAYAPGDDQLPPEEMVIVLPGGINALRFVFDQ